MIITLTGPTAAGKSTIERELQALGCGRAISHTTRAPRGTEKDGVEYHFIADAEYDRLEHLGAFIETVQLGSRRYAMSKEALVFAQRSVKHVAIVVDPHGASQIREYCQQNNMPAHSVWIDCGEQEQARRFITRLVQDQRAGKEVQVTYAERLALMLADEMSWRKAAAIWMIADGWTYQQKVSNRGGMTPQELARIILDNVEMASRQPNIETSFLVA